jgi:hypothetical protein
VLHRKNINEVTSMDEQAESAPPLAGMVAGIILRIPSGHEWKIDATE